MLIPRAVQGGQHVLTGTEQRDGAIDQQQDLVDAVEQRGALGDGDDGDFLRLGVLEGAHQRRIPGTVEIGIGLVEHDHARIAEEGARQRDALFLAAGKRRSVGGNHGLVAVRQVGDHFMDVGEHGCLIDLFVGCVLAHAGDVGLDRAGEELHVLRQVADILAELPLVPVAEVHQVAAGHFPRSAGSSPPASCRASSCPRRNCR